MANLNLSEFTEKLFVADADHTFIWDTDASISKRVSRNSWLSGTTADFHLGLADAASPVAQTISVQSVAAGTTNTAGAAFTIDGSQGTGTGAGGALIFRTAPAGSSGSTQNAFGTAVTIASDGRTVPYNWINLDGFNKGIELYGSINDALTRNAGSSRRVVLTSQALALNSGFTLGWTSFSGSGNDGANPGQMDTILLRDGAPNTLALRNGAAAQTFRVYNTFPGTGNNEFGSLNWVDQPNEFQITTGQAGSGTGRALCLRAGGGINIRIGGAPGTLVWQFGTSTGHFLAATDNSVDIGASGAARPRNVYVANNVTVGNTVSTGICDVTAIRLAANGSGCVIRQDSNGIIRLSNNNESDFTRLQFGGATDAAPAIARDGAGIKFTGAAAGSTAWIKVPPVAVGSLPVAATAGAGARAFVNDASAPVFGTAVAGGGAVLVPVYCTGSAWNVG